MDSVDAVNLLIAVVAAPINGPAVVSSAAACELYSKLSLSRESTSLRRWRDAKIPRLATPSSSRTFRDLLISLIDAERAGELEESMRGTRFWHFLFSVRAPFPYVEVVFDVPDIHIELKYGDDVPEEEGQRHAWYSARLKKFQAGDLRQTRWFTHLTIREIGTLLGARIGQI